MREVCENRLKNIAIQDRSENNHKIKKLLKAELIYLLKNYFDITADSLDVDISVDGTGKYNISMNARANVIKVVKLF